MIEYKNEIDSPLFKYIYIYKVETYIKKLIDWSTVIIYTFQEQLDSISQR